MADPFDDDEGGSGDAEATPKKRKRRWRTKPAPPKGVEAVVWDRFLDLESEGGRSGDQMAEALGVSSRTIWRWRSMLRVTKDDRRNGGGEGPPPELDADPGAAFEHMGVARAAASSERVHVRDRLRAVQILELRRQWDAEHERQGRVDWATVRLEDIPHEHRARLAGLLAEVLVESKAPALGLADTTEAQATAWYQLGLLLHPDDAALVCRDVLSPALARALGMAERLVVEREAGERAVAAGGSEVAAEEFLRHV